MRTINNNWGRGVHCAGVGRNRPGVSEGKPTGTAGIGSAAGMTYGLAAGLMLWASAASGQEAYAMEFNQSQNYFGQVNLLTGAFTPLGSEGSTLFNDIAAAPNGTIYGIVNSSSLVTLDPTSGNILSSVSFNVSGIESLAIAPDGTVYGATQSALYTIDALTGDASLVGNFDNGVINGVGQNIRFAADGELYDTDGGVNAQNTDLFRISLLDGSASTVGVINNFPGLCLENAGQVMYGVGIQINSASTLQQDLVGLDLASIQPGGTNADGTIASIRDVMVTGNFPNNYNFSSSSDYTVPGTPIVPAPEPGIGASFVAGAVLLLAFNQRKRF